MQNSFDNTANQFTVVSSTQMPVTIELDALLRDYLLGLVLIAGIRKDVGKQPVQWVHSSDLLDPTPFLTPRTVLLTTGAQFSNTIDNEATNQFVQRLVSAGTTALGVAIGIHWDRIPPELIAACDRHKLALFRVPYDTPFIAVVRTAARLLAAQTHLVERRAANQGEFGSIFGRRRAIAEAEVALRQAVLQLLISGNTELAHTIAEPLLARLPQDNISVAFFALPAQPKTLTPLRTFLGQTEGVFSAESGEHIVVITEPAPAKELRKLLTDHNMKCGFSERGSLADISELSEQAERAYELARMQAENTVLDYRPAMHSGVLQLLQNSPEATRRADGLLAPLRQHDARNTDNLEHSVQVWLRHNGHFTQASRELAVHRHTLKTRIQLASSLLQRDLETADARNELWAAMRLSPVPLT